MRVLRISLCRADVLRAVGQALLALGRLTGLELWGTARGEHAALIRELGATPIGLAMRRA
jgi:hypothetical protein